MALNPKFHKGISALLTNMGYHLRHSLLLYQMAKTTFEVILKSPYHTSQSVRPHSHP